MRLARSANLVADGLYRQSPRLVERVATAARPIQNGDVNLYLLYMLVVVLIAYVVYVS